MWLIILLAAIAAILSYKAFENKVDRRLRSEVFGRLSRMFPQARVKIERVTIEGPTKVTVHGLQIAVVDGQRPRQILKVDRVELTGDLDIAHAVQETVSVHRVDIYRPQLDLWQLSSGQWSLSALECKSTDGQPTPTVCIHQGDLRLFRNGRSNSGPIVFHDINGQVSEGEILQTETNLPVSSSAPISPPSRLRLADLQSSRPLHRLEGKFKARSSGSCEAIEVGGWLDRSQGKWHLEGAMREIDFSSDLIAKLPGDLSRSLSQLTGLSCKASALFYMNKAGSTAPWEFRVKGKLGYGRLQDARLPYPLDELSGDFYCDNMSLQLRDIKARSGQASFKLDTDIKGFHPQAPVVISAEATMLQLDGRLYNALPAKWRSYWDRVKPEGNVDAKVKLSSDGTTWRPCLEIDCRDVQLECWLFPYQLSKVVGQVVIEPESLVGVNLRGKAGGQPVAGSFNFLRVQQEWYGKLQLNVDGAIAIDQKVLTALTMRGQPVSNVERFVRSLEPSGTFHIHKAHFHRQINEPAYWHKDLDISVADCSMLYQGFRYPLHRIHGRILATDDRWRLEGFEGWNDSGRIQCNGEWVDQREAGVPFQLAFTAYSLPMEEELQRALPADARQLWEQIQPSGSIDRADVSIVRSQGNEKVNVEVVLHEDNNTNAATGQSLRLHPKACPYWLSDVACDLTYQPGLLEISQASATNASSRVSLRARCQQNAVGNWVGFVHWLPSSRVMVDTQLLRALPDSISNGLIEMDIRGPVNIMGETKFELPIDGTPPTTDLDMQLELEDVQLGEGKVVDGIRGTVRLTGRRNSAQMVAACWADIDAVSLRGVPLTHVRGPLALVGNQIYFGSDVTGHVDPASGLTATDISADALSGVLKLSGSGQLDTGRFQIKSTLTDADLRCMLQDLGVSQAPTDALCQAELTLTGIPWEPQTYNGAGAIHLRDAQLYQLPTMMQLLRKLSVKPTDKAAFHTADIDFTIDGDRIPLKLACEGNVLSLRGSGWTNFRKELDLELYSYVGGRVPVSSVLTPLIAETPYASFMSLDVDGTLDNPRFERRAFPQLAVLQQIFPDKVARQDEPKRLLERWRQDRNEVTKSAESLGNAETPLYR